MQNDWYIRRSDEQWGPLQQGEFDELRLQGRINDDDWVWRSGWANWKRFADIRQGSASGPPPIPTTDSGTSKEAVSRLVDEHLLSLRIQPRERSRYQYAELLDDFLGLPDCIESRTIAQHQEAISLASALIRNFWWSCQRTDTDNEEPVEAPERYRTIWRHRDLALAFKQGYTSSHACPMDREAMAGQAVQYLKQHLRSAKFEALLVDAIVAREVYAYGEELKQHPSRFAGRMSLSNVIAAMDEAAAYGKAKGNLDELAWARLKSGLKIALVRGCLLYGVPSGIAWFAAENDWQGTLIAALGFIGIVVAFRIASWMWRIVRSVFSATPRTPYEKALALYQTMVLAYEQLAGGAAASPRRVREVLAKAEDEGAAWHPGVFAILDGAIARSQGNWR